MQKVTVRLGAQPESVYTVFIGAGILEKIADLYDFESYSNLFVVTDETVEPLFLDDLAGALPGDTASIVLPAGEQYKNIETVQMIWMAMQAAGCDRKSLVINLGGGVVCDLGGFAASTYMRGVDFLNVPTTLLAQVDASVGGKTGFNFAGVKNLVGSFNQPMAVIIDPQTLSKLPEREFIAGFGEIVKHGLVTDAAYFDEVAACQPLKLTASELEGVIAKSCRIKQQIVEADVNESAARRLVNFGHTIGHAIEALSLETDSPLLHGEAVSVGMLAEARISEYSGTLKSEDVNKVKEALVKVGLPVTVSGFSVEDILDRMQSDKKNENGMLNFTLLDGIGRARYNQTADREVVIKAVKTVLED